MRSTRWTPLKEKRNWGKQKMRWRDEIQNFVKNINSYQNTWLKKNLRMPPFTNG